MYTYLGDVGSEKWKVRSSVLDRTIMNTFERANIFVVAEMHKISRHMPDFDL